MKLEIYLRDKINSRNKEDIEKVDKVIEYLNTLESKNSIIDADNFCELSKYINYDEIVRLIQLKINEQKKYVNDLFKDNNFEEIFKILSEIKDLCKENEKNKINCENNKLYIHKIITDDENEVDLKLISKKEDINDCDEKQILRLKRIILLFLSNKKVLDINIKEIFNRQYLNLIYGLDEDDEEDEDINNILKKLSDIEKEIGHEMKVIDMYNQFIMITTDIIGTTILNFTQNYYQNIDKKMLKNTVDYVLFLYLYERTLTKANIEENIIGSYISSRESIALDYSPDIFEIINTEIDSEQSNIVYHPNKDIYCKKFNDFEYFKITHEFGHILSNSHSVKDSTGLDIDVEPIVKLNGIDIKLSTKADPASFISDPTAFDCLKPNIKKDLLNANWNKLFDLLADWFSSNLLIEKLENDTKTIVDEKDKNTQILKQFIYVLSQMSGDFSHFDSETRMMINIIINDKIYDLFINYYDKYIKTTEEGGNYYKKYLKYKLKYIELKKLKK